MAFVSIDSSAVKLTLKHVETKRDGSFQYRRRIPKDLQPRYLGRKFFVRSLGRDVNALQNRAINLTNQLDTDWCTLRGQDTQSETLIVRNLPNPFLNIDRQKLFGSVGLARYQIN